MIEPERGDRAIVGRLRQRARLVHLGHEVIDQPFVVAIERRLAAMADRLDHVGRNPGLQRMPGVREPFVLRRPVPGDDQHHHLEQPQVEVAVAQRRAELVGGVGELGIAQPDRERPAHRAAAGAGDAVVDGLLFGRQALRIQVFHTGHSLLLTAWRFVDRVSDNRPN